MTTLTAVARRGASPLDVLRLHFSQRGLLLRTPPLIMLVVFALTVVFAVIFVVLCRLSTSFLRAWSSVDDTVCAHIHL